MNCISCDTEHSEKFCPNCGEKGEVERITFLRIVSESFTKITNVELGFLYNLKYLVLDPKKLVSEYIAGKRKGIFNPLSFFFICTSLYAFIFFRDSNCVIDFNFDRSVFYRFGQGYSYLSDIYFKEFWMTSAFWLAIANKAVFHKYNFAEHFAIASFILGFVTLIGIMIHYVFHISITFDPFINGIIFLSLIRVFSKPNKKVETGVLTFVSFSLYLIITIIMMCLAGYIMMHFNQ